MADDVLWVLDADAEPTVAALEQIDAAASAMGDALSESVASMEEEISTLTESLTELSALADETSGAMGGMSEAMSSMGDTIAEDNTMISSLNEQITNLEAQLQALTGAEEEAAAGAEGLGAAEETAAGESTSFGDALSAAMGPLMMIGTAAALAGGKFVQMGMDGQKGEALLSGMAGASQQDIQALQQEALKLGVSMDQASQGFYEVESAGYSGRDAITVFDNAMKLSEGGQAQASDVMTGLTAIMHDYGLGADQAGGVTDKMAEAVLRGKQQMEDFATSIGPLASAGHNAGVGLNEVLAAESTMTQINPHVRQDTMQLAGLFQSLSPTMGHTAETAKSLGLSFNEAHFASLDLMGKLQYLAQIAGGDNTAAFIKLTGGVRGSTAAIDLLTGKGQAFKGNLDAMGHSAGATAHAFDSWENTIPAHLDKVGAALSVFATKLMDAIGPKITPIIDHITTAIGQMSDLIINHTAQVAPILAGLAAVIGGVLIAAIGSLVVAAAPIIGIALAIGIVVAGVVWAFQHWGDIMKQVNSVLAIPAVHQIVSALQGVWSFLVANFMPVWQQLVNLWQSQIVPLGKQLWDALQPLMPLFIGIAEIIGGVLLVALGLIVGAIAGIIKGLAGFLSGLVIVIGGVIRLITGVVQIISGIIRVIIDLVTLNFSDLGPALGQIWQGIINVFHGAWDIIRGIFLTAWYTISGIVTGFVQGIIGFFTHLWDMLVGHSIIPDMVKSILEWFTNLVDEGIAFITNLVVTILMWMVHMEVMVLSTISEMVNIFLSWLDHMTGGAVSKAQSVVSGITGVLGKLGSMALTWGSDMINGFIQGVKNVAGNLSGVVSGIASNIKHLLGFSKPSEGPLADADTYMPDFVDLLAQGLTNNTAKLKQAVSGVASSLAGGITPTVSVAGAGSSGISGGATNPVFLQMLAVLQQILQQQQRGGTSGGGNVSSSVTMNNSFNGVSNIQQLYQMLNQMAGQQFESGLRGAY